MREKTDANHRNGTSKCKASDRLSHYDEVNSPLEQVVSYKYSYNGKKDFITRYVHMRFL